MSFLRKAGILSLLFFFLFAADRFLKIYYLKSGVSRIFITGIVETGMQTNYGIAFGLNLPPYLTVAIVGVIILVLGYLLVDCLMKKNIFLYGVFLSIFAGAVSNYIDRLKYGFVIDYIDVPFFTVFNISDILITFAFAVLIVKTIKQNSKKTI